MKTKTKSKNSYTPRKLAKQWLEGAPAEVLACYANKCGTFDVIYAVYPAEDRTFANCIVAGREMDSDPCHPQGVGMYFEISAWDFCRYRERNKRRRIKWEDLPEKVKACVLSDIKPAA